MIATTKQECFNFMCKQDTPANADQRLNYQINDKEGRTICDGYNLDEVIEVYVKHMEDLAIEDEEYYRWSEDIVIDVIDEEDNESHIKRTVHMDTRGDGYDHGRFDYMSTRI